MDAPEQAWGRQDTAQAMGDGTARLHSRFCSRSRLRGIAYLLLLLPSLTSGEQLEKHDTYAVEAAYLRNFAHYVTWPDDAFSESPSEWRICVLGPDPFGSVLENLVKVRPEQGRSFVVLRAEKLEDLPQCQIVYIAYSDARSRRAALRELKNKPILTVSEAVDFLREGGVVQFLVSDRVSMSINLDQARRSRLQIQTKMLEVSREIFENGVARRMR